MGNLVRLDIKINGEDAPPLATIVHRDAAHSVGKGLTEKLKELIPRQLFRVPIQACIGVKPVASSAIPPMRKDVLAKCYGGDITRKKKLLQKQAKGKKRMKAMGKVDVRRRPLWQCSTSRTNKSSRLAELALRLRTVFPCRMSLS